MSILRILVGLLAVFIAFPAFANDVQVGRGVICDTKEQPSDTSRFSRITLLRR